MNQRRLLLISSSLTHGTGFLDHCADAIQEHLQGVKRMLFVPYALFDRDEYTRVVRERFAQWNIEVEGLHTQQRPAEAIHQAEAMFIGGGNSFRLLKCLQDQELLEPIRKRVAAGMPYMGSSAGTNVACPTIRTTNDMPIVEPTSFQSLGLVSFQINPHFVQADPESTHQGETREQRLQEFLEENDQTVVGIPEGTWLQVQGESGRIEGARDAHLFSRSGVETRPPGSSINDLLTERF